MRLDGPRGARPLRITQRCFDDAEVAAALAGAGLAMETATPWSYVQADSPSKTWFVASKLCL